VGEGSLANEIRGQLRLRVRKCRWIRLIMEAGYDAVAWIGGLLVAVRGAGAPAEIHLTRSAFWYGLPVICGLVTGCGLMAGLYRCRYLRGSRDEVARVVLAGFLAACSLAIVGLALVAGRRLFFLYVMCCYVLSVVVMLFAV
jgi:hypothetical protein